MFAIVRSALRVVTTHVGAGLVRERSPVAFETTTLLLAGDDLLVSIHQAKRGGMLAKKTMFISDKSGSVIPEGQGAKVTIRFSDARRGVREADVTIQEADQVAQELSARAVARRGRKPQSQA